MPRGGGNKRPRTGGGGRGGAHGDIKKAKYLPKGSSNSIPIGSRGFLVSCVAGKEQEAGREIVDALEEEYERMATEAAKKERKKNGAEKGGNDNDDKEKAASSSDDDEEQERELDAGADLASALAAEISGLKEKGEGGKGGGGKGGDDEKRKKKKKGLRYHVLGLPGLVYVSGAGSAAISAAEAAAGEGAGGAAAAAGGDESAPPRSSSSPQQQLQGPLPSDVACSLCSRIREEREGTTRFCLRLLPADDVVFVGGGGGGQKSDGSAAEGEGAEEAATKATTAKEAATANAARAITEGLRPLLARHFAAAAPAAEEEGAGKEKGGGKGAQNIDLSKTFAVAYEKRASTANLERKLVIDAALAALPEVDGGVEEGEGGRKHGIKVDLDNPSVTALIQVVKGAAALGAVRDYKGLLKLNMRELAAPGSTAAADNARRAAKE